MIIVLLCAGSALIGYILGLLMAERIAQGKIAEMRSQMGLDIETGEDLCSKEDELLKVLFKEE